MAAGFAAVLTRARASVRGLPLSAPVADESGSVTVCEAPLAETSQPHAEPVDSPPPQRVPATPAIAVDPTDAVHALYVSARALAPAVAAHLWLQDPATASLRLVAADGERLPSSRPMAVDEPSISAVASRGESSMEPVVALTDEDGVSTLWRYAFPVTAGGSFGVGCIDIVSTDRVDVAGIDSLVLGSLPAFAAALALHVSRTETATAGNLIEAAYELSRRLRPEDVADRTLDRAMTLSSAANGSVLLMDESGVMRIAASRGLPDDVVADSAVAPGEGIAGWVYSSGKPLLVEDMPGRDKPPRHGVRSAVCVPIADEDGCLGVLSVGSREFPARFTHSHVHALEALGRLAAVALRNARAVQSSTTLSFSTLTALAIALETKDPYGQGCTGRVTELVSALAAKMHLTQPERDTLHVAALLHDVGMSLAGAPIGATARPLSITERGLLKAHPGVAAEILAKVPALHEVVPIVFHHHEWYDGHGYEGGISGEAIPLGSRILAVADAFVAMTSARPYRRAMSVDRAVGELTSKSGTQFDPEVVTSLKSLLEEDPAVAFAGRID